MTQQVTIELTGGRIEAFAGKETTKPTVTTSTVAMSESPQTFENPILSELRELYGQIVALPLGHPGRVTRMQRWKTLEAKVRGIAL